MSEAWSILCPVDVGPLASWLAVGDPDWPPVKGGQPNRIHAPAAATPIIEQVLTCFASPVTYSRYYACLSRLVPGAAYEYHQDPQLPEWITRVHVPVVTNAGAWLAFEEEGGRHVHFEAGWAYSFNALKSHRYANDGGADRVHLLFDVLRGTDAGANRRHAGRGWPAQSEGSRPGGRE